MIIDFLFYTRFSYSAGVTCSVAYKQMADEVGLDLFAIAALLQQLLLTYFFGSLVLFRLQV